MIKNDDAVKGAIIQLNLDEQKYVVGPQESEPLRFQFADLPLVALGKVFINGIEANKTTQYTQEQFSSATLVLADVERNSAERVGSWQISWSVTDGKSTRFESKSIAIDNKPASNDQDDTTSGGQENPDVAVIKQSVLDRINQDQSPIKVSYVEEEQILSQGLISVAGSGADPTTIQELRTVLEGLVAEPDVVIVPTISMNRYSVGQRVQKSFTEIFDPNPLNLKPSQLNYQDANADTKDYLMSLAVQSNTSTASVVGANLPTLSRKHHLLDRPRQQRRQAAGGGSCCGPRPAGNCGVSAG